MPKNFFGQTKADSSKLYYDAIWYSQKSKVSIDSAINYFEKRSANFLSNKDTIKAINSLRSVTQGHFKKGAIFESELSVVKTFELLEDKSLDSFTIANKKGLYMHLGMLYRQMSDYKSAIENYNRALELSESTKDSIDIMNNLANIYSDTEEYRFATDKLNFVYEKIKFIEGYENEWTVLDNLGYNQSKLNISGALNKMELALSKRLEDDDIQGVFSSYRHLTYYYIDRHDENKSLEYAEKASYLAESLNLPSYELEGLRLKILLSNDLKTREFLRLFDSINAARKVSDNKYVNKKYNFSEYKRKAAESQLNEEKQKRFKLLYQVIGTFILLLAIFLYFVLKSKHKKDKIKQAYRKELEFSKKIHDELANDVSDVMNYVENDIETSNDKKTLLLDNLEDIYLRTRDISTETASIDLANFSQGLSNLLLQHNREGTKVLINDINTIDWNTIPDYKKMIVYRCLQELMVNMKKHSKAKLVSIVFKTDKSKNEIRYVDDGVGVSIEEVQFNGLLNVESRIKSIQGSFNFITSLGNGFKATLKFNS